MKKTTVYLPEKLKAALERTAAAQQKSEADVIREAVDKATEKYKWKRPTGGMFKSGLPPDAAENLDDYMDGFGEDW